MAFLRRSWAVLSLLLPLLLTACAGGLQPASLRGSRGLPAPAPAGSSPCAGFSFCDYGGSPCDPASACVCAYMTHTCETRYNWCSNDGQCRDALDDPGARCIANACWGTGVDCRSEPCKNGFGCASDRDCEAGWKCSTGNGVCQGP